MDHIPPLEKYFDPNLWSHLNFLIWQFYNRKGFTTHYFIKLFWMYILSFTRMSSTIVPFDEVEPIVVVSLEKLLTESKLWCNGEKWSSLRRRCWWWDYEGSHEGRIFEHPYSNVLNHYFQVSHKRYIWVDISFRCAVM